MGKTNYQDYPQETFKERAFIHAYRTPQGSRRQARTSGTHSGIDSDIDPKIAAIVRKKALHA